MIDLCLTPKAPYKCFLSCEQFARTCQSTGPRLRSLNSQTLPVDSLTRCEVIVIRVSVVFAELHGAEDRRPSKDWWARMAAGALSFSLVSGSSVSLGAKPLTSLKSRSASRDFTSHMPVTADDK